MPVYNAEQYLASSIDSVLAQSVKDFELLLINDGSKDNSLAICQEYAAKDSRVRVLDKPNGGVSSARNLGLDEAKGEWLMFIDSDDWLTEDTLATCLAYTPEYDTICFSFTLYFVDNKRHNQPVPAVKNLKHFFRLQIQRHVGQRACGALYRRSIIAQNKIYFDPTIIYGEDWLWHMRVSQFCTKVMTLPNAFCYKYNLMNMSSCTNTMSPRKIIQQLQVLKTIKKHMRKESLLGEASKYRKQFRDTRCNVIIDLLRVFSPEEGCAIIADMRERIDFIDKWDIILADISLRKKRRLWKFLRYCHSHGVK